MVSESEMRELSCVRLRVGVTPVTDSEAATSGTTGGEASEATGVVRLREPRYSNRGRWQGRLGNTDVIVTETMCV